MTSNKPLEKDPTKLVFTPSQSRGVQQIKERGNDIHLPITRCSANIPNDQLCKHL